MTAQDAKICKRKCSFPFPQKIKKYKNIIRTHEHPIYRPVSATLIQQGLPVTDSSPLSNQDSLILSIIYSPTHAEAQKFQPTTTQTENISTFCTLLWAQAQVH